MKEKHFNEKVRIVILPSAAKATYSEIDTTRIRETVRERLLLTASEPYLRVQVRVQHRPNGNPESLVATMLRAYTYTADIVKLEVDETFGFRSIERGYAYETIPLEAGTIPPGGRLPFPPGLKPQMAFGTPVPEIPTAKAAVETACAIAKRAGFRVVKLLGPQASVANYQRLLTSGLLAFGNVGHGYTGGIVLADGNLTYSWYNSLGNTALKPAVVYFNSCQVFNDPLLQAIMKAGARTFIGGIINLLIGASEQVFQCFWKKTLIGTELMGSALRSCEKEHYPVANAHGIKGDTGKFRRRPFAVEKKPRHAPAKSTRRARAR